MKKPARRVTLIDVATKMGISPATVSLALRDKDGVAEKTRAAVHRTAKNMGYVPNRSAAQLRTRRSDTVGLIVPNINNPFFAEVTNSVEERLDQAGCSLLLAKTSDLLEKQSKAITTMMGYSVDGVLICPAIGTELKHLRHLVQSRLPAVFFTRSVPDMQQNYVGADNSAGTYLATRTLLEKGHRKICFVGGSRDSITRGERCAGYSKALRDHGIQPAEGLDLPGETTMSGGFQIIRGILASPNHPTAAVCYNDVVAFGVILGLWASRIVPGKDFMVTGFDNLSDSAFWSPPLTTLSCPPQEIGRRAAELLLERIFDPQKPTATIILDPVLVERDT